MKKAVAIMLSTTCISILIIFLALCIRMIWKIGNSQTSAQETFLVSSQSPDSEYYLEAYKMEPGATVDFSIKVYMIKGEEKNLIYDAYHEYEAEIVWIDNVTVSINGKMLDLSLGETYDWRTE